MGTINIRHVNLTVGTVSALVAELDGSHHKVGHLPSEGWFCIQHGTRCPYIEEVRILIPDIPDRPLTSTE